MRSSLTSPTAADVRHGGWTVVASLACAALLLRLFGCGSGLPDDPYGGFDRQALLADTAEQVLLVTYETFDASAGVLEGAVAAWADAVASGVDGSEARSTAQDAWRAATVDWQRAEVMQIGPAGQAAEVVGGLALRDELYSWPTVNPCRVDQEIVAGEWDEEDFFSVSLVHVYGLDALEYLLFVDGPDNACASQVGINDDGTWSALGEEEIDLRRSAYAAAAASALSVQATDLLQRWQSDGGDFAGAFATAGEDGSPYVEVGEAMDDLFAALFYLALEVKDQKLAKPLGIVDCGTPTCPDALESQYADQSLAYLRANLEGGQLLFHGGAGEEHLGLDDMLIFNEHAEVAENVSLAFDLALEAVDAVPQTALSQLADDPAPLAVIHQAVVDLVHLLEGEVATTLLLQVPQEAANDND